MSTYSRVVRTKRSKSNPDHEDECIVRDTDNHVHVARYIANERVWFDRSYEIIDVIEWVDVDDIDWE